MIWIAAILVFAIVIAAAAIRRALLIERDGHWHPDSPLTMRRFTNGRWEKRSMSEAEIVDYQHSDAW